MTVLTTPSGGSVHPRVSIGQPGNGLLLAGVTRRFAARVALDGLSLSVPPGEVLGLIGPNGAGKTTAMRVVLGVLTPDEGEVLWNGRRVDGPVRRRFGALPEERGLYPKMRVGDHIRYLARLHGLDGNAAATGTERWLHRLGLGSREHDRVEALSLGNQQRVQLAAALVHGPVLLVADEPFSGLDPVGVQSLSEVVREEAARGVAVVLSSHQLDLVEELCDSVAVLVQGRLIKAGSVGHLRDTGPRRFRLEMDGGHVDALSALPGVRAVTRSVGGGAATVLLDVDDDIDENRLLAEAGRAGRIRSFTPERPRLSDVFRAAVQS